MLQSLLTYYNITNIGQPKIISMSLTVDFNYKSLLNSLDKNFCFSGYMWVKKKRCCFDRKKDVIRWIQHLQ